MAEAAERLVDDAITRAKDGAIEIMYVGGGHKCWRSDGYGVSQMWGDVATLVRARMNRRIESYKAMGISPRIMILDRVSLYRKLRHPPGDFYHFWSDHSDYKKDMDGQM
eukprot:8496030-Pyramimonas_sp.AAC.1